MRRRKVSWAGASIGFAYLVFGTVTMADQQPQVDLQVGDAASPLVSQEFGQWPQWRGPNRDNISTEKGLLKNWPEGGPLLDWHIDGIGEGIASVSIANGRMYTVGYVDESEYALALDRRTGELAWASRLGPAVGENRLMRWLSQRSPTVDIGRVYVMRADGDLVCLQATDASNCGEKVVPGTLALAGRPGDSAIVLW